MKAATSILLFLGAALLCRTAIAQGPITLASVAHVGYSYPVLQEANGLQAASPTPNRPAPLTHNGKVMRGVGIALLGLGAGVITIDAILTNCSGIGCGGHTGRSAAGFVGGGGIAATGVTLIVLGNRRRTER